MQIWCQFRIKIASEMAPSNGVIWDELSEQRKTKASKKAPVLELYDL